MREKNISQGFWHPDRTQGSMTGIVAENGIDIALTFLPAGVVTVGPNYSNANFALTVEGDPRPVAYDSGSGTSTINLKVVGTPIVGEEVCILYYTKKQGALRSSAGHVRTMNVLLVNSSLL